MDPIGTVDKSGLRDKIISNCGLLKYKMDYGKSSRANTDTFTEKKCSHLTTTFNVFYTPRVNNWYFNHVNNRRGRCV